MSTCITPSAVWRGKNLMTGWAARVRVGRVRSQRNVPQALISRGMMSEGEGTMQNEDRLNIYTRHWLPSDPKAVVFIAHGVSDHCGRHCKLAGILQDNGYAVYAQDHVGHGKSNGDRMHIDDFSIYVRDMIQHTDLLKAKYPELPFFAIGASMGGTIAALTVIERPSLFNGVVFSAPAVQGTVGYLRGMMVRLVAFFSPQQIILNYDPNVISTIAKEVEERSQDPLVCQDGPKAQWTVALIDAQYKIEQRVHEIAVPFLTLHGSRDKAVATSASEFLMERTQSKDKTIKVFEGSRHALFRDKDQELVKQVVLDWLNTHTVQ